ncbi:TPA: hypothetical protein ACX6QP_002190 [Photobacterium damselae]
MPNNTPKDDAGRYLTAGLNEREFQQTLKHIQSQQSANRRKAKRTLTAGILAKKAIRDIARLGEKAPGIPFTKEDLKEFEKDRKNHKIKYDSATAGITFAQMVSGSRDIDIKRANNKVNDGSGISRANLSGIKGNIVLVRVKASSISKHEEHQVKIRLEEWDDVMQDPPAGDYKKAAQKAAKGRISIDCSCGRHQYWYRYQATMGNYCVAPPKEFAYPKIRNPKLKGVACKHVLKASVMLQSAAWHTILGRQLEVQAHQVSFGGDRKRNHVLNEKELKEASRNRSTKIDKAKLQAEYRKYQKAQKGLKRKLASSSKEIERIRKQANKIRKQSNTIQKQEQQIGQIRDMLKLSFSMFADTMKSNGYSKKDAMSAFAKKMKINPSKLEKVLK